MKAYAMDLRQRVVAYAKEGHSKVQTAQVFKIARRSVYRYLKAEETGMLEPKKSWGHWRKLDPEKLREHVKENPDATLEEMGEVFAVSHNAIWVRLGKLGITLKKTHKIPGKKRTGTLAVQTRARATRSGQGVLPGRKRN